MIYWQLIIFVTLICLVFSVIWELGEEIVNAVRRDREDD